jgi:hypothetical protein
VVSADPEWQRDGAREGVVMEAGGDPNTMAAQITDAFPSLQNGLPTYMLFCVYPQSSTGHALTSAGNLDFLVDSLYTGLYGNGIIGTLNTYGGYLVVVYDLEDGSTCGPWSAMNQAGACSNNSGLTCTYAEAQADITIWSQLILNRLQTDGLNQNIQVLFAANPGLSGPYSGTSTDRLSAWITNALPNQFLRLGVVFPQLFGPFVRQGCCGPGGDTPLIIGRLIGDGIDYREFDMVEEDRVTGDGTCDAQSSVDTIHQGALYGTTPNLEIWYVDNAPWCPM